NSRVAIDADVGCAVEQLKEAAATPPAADIEEQIVPDGDACGAPTRMDVVAAEHVDAGPDVPDNVVREGHILDDRPGGGAVLIPNGKQNREPVLRLGPVVLEDVAFDDHSSGVLQLEEVLDGPLRALEVPASRAPPERFGEMIAANLDIGRHEIWNRWIGAA